MCNTNLALFNSKPISLAVPILVLVFSYLITENVVMVEMFLPLMLDSLASYF